MPFSVSAAVRLHRDALPSSFYNGVFFKHGGYDICFKKSKQGTLSETVLQPLPWIHFIACLAPEKIQNRECGSQMLVIKFGTEISDTY
jgi:hypothetical protein